MILIFQRTWQRPPTRQELDGIVKEYVKEEVLYREALAMGLDRDDTLVRRRLRQKLEFVAEDMADAVDPTDAELQQYLDEHPESFRVERRASFYQVYLSRDRRGDSLNADSMKMLAKLRSGEGWSGPPPRNGTPESWPSDATIPPWSPTTTSTVRSNGRCSR